MANFEEIFGTKNIFYWIIPTNPYKNGYKIKFDNNEFLIIWSQLNY